MHACTRFSGEASLEAGRAMQRLNNLNVKTFSNVSFSKRYMSYEMPFGFYRVYQKN